MTLSIDQQSIVRASAVAVAVSAMAIAGSWLWVPPRLFGLVPDLPLAERLAFVLRADLLVFLWLVACVQAVASGRFRSAADIGGSARSEPSPRIAVRCAVLQNSLEQTVLVMGSHLVLATVLRSSEMVLIPTFVALFVVGRIAFALGYARGRTGRAFGMALTATPIFAGYSLAVVLLATGR
jgi:hypothetical protein